MQPILSESINSEDGNCNSWIAIQRFREELLDVDSPESQQRGERSSSIPAPLPTVRNAMRGNLAIPRNASFDPTDRGQKNIERSMEGKLAFDFSNMTKESEEEPKMLGFGDHSAIEPAADIEFEIKEDSKLFEHPNTVPVLKADLFELCRDNEQEYMTLGCQPNGLLDQQTPKIGCQAGESGSSRKKSSAKKKTPRQQSSSGKKRDLGRAQRFKVKSGNKKKKKKSPREFSFSRNDSYRSPEDSQKKPKLDVNELRTSDEFGQILKKQSPSKSSVHSSAVKESERKQLEEMGMSTNEIEFCLQIVESNQKMKEGRYVTQETADTPDSKNLLRVLDNASTASKSTSKKKDHHFQEDRKKRKVMKHVPESKVRLYNPDDPIGEIELLRAENNRLKADLFAMNDIVESLRESHLEEQENRRKLEEELENQKGQNVEMFSLMMQQIQDIQNKMKYQPETVMMQLPCQSPSPAASDFSEGFGFD